MITIDMHHVAKARVMHYTDHNPAPFVTVSAHDKHGNRVALFFSADDDGTELDAAEAWLLEALGKVVDAKISDQAKRDADSAAVARFEAEGLAAFGSARIGEPIDPTAVNL